MNNKKEFTVLISFILGAFMLITFSSWTKNEPSAPKQTVIFHTADLNQLTKIVTDYAKLGYTVTQMESQAVTNTYGGRSSCGGDCQVIKSEIVVVLVK
jgi:hypothetical protein